MLRTILRDIVSLSAQAVAFRMTVGADSDTIVALHPMKKPSTEDDDSDERRTIGIVGKSNIEARRIGF